MAYAPAFMPFRLNQPEVSLLMPLLKVTVRTCQLLLNLDLTNSHFGIALYSITKDIISTMNVPLPNYKSY